MRQNLRGELTLPSMATQFSIESSSKLVANVLDLVRSISVPADHSGTLTPTKSEISDSQKVLIPMMLCQCARTNDLEGIKAILAEHDSLINVGDYMGKVR
jgi:hypothetical protein